MLDEGERPEVPREAKGPREHREAIDSPNARPAAARAPQHHREEHAVEGRAGEEADAVQYLNEVLGGHGASPVSRTTNENAIVYDLPERSLACIWFSAPRASCWPESSFSPAHQAPTPGVPPAIARWDESRNATWLRKQRRSSPNCSLPSNSPTSRPGQTRSAPSPNGPKPTLGTGSPSPMGRPTTPRRRTPAAMSWRRSLDSRRCSPTARRRSGNAPRR